MNSFQVFFFFRLYERSRLPLFSTGQKWDLSFEDNYLHEKKKNRIYVYKTRGERYIFSIKLLNKCFIFFFFFNRELKFDLEK